MSARRELPEPIYQRDEPIQSNHHVGHTDTCGLTGLYTYILCLAGCGSYMPWPPPHDGPRGHYCPPCWEKERPTDQIPTVAERRAQTAQYVVRLERLQNRMTMPDVKIESDELSDEERAWAVARKRE